MEAMMSNKGVRVNRLQNLMTNLTTKKQIIYFVQEKIENYQ